MAVRRWFILIFGLCGGAMIPFLFGAAYLEGGDEPIATPSKPMNGTAVFVKKSSGPLKVPASEVREAEPTPGIMIKVDDRLTGADHGLHTDIARHLLIGAQRS